MDVICINDKFSQQILEFYKLHDITTPKKDVVYQIREIIKTMNGSGLLLEEIHNKNVPIKGYTGIFWIEPNWALPRFVDINGNDLVLNEILESIKSIKLDVGLQLVGDDSFDQN